MDGEGNYRIKPTRRVRTCVQDLLLGELAAE